MVYMPGAASPTCTAAGPVLDLSFLIDHVMMDIKPLHWGEVIRSDVPLKVELERTFAVHFATCELHDRICCIVEHLHLTKICCCC
jgi:hypothetical protein